MVKENVNRYRCHTLLVTNFLEKLENNGELLAANGGTILEKLWI